jgi:hypothetical protein
VPYLLCGGVGIIDLLDRRSSCLYKRLPCGMIVASSLRVCHAFVGLAIGWFPCSGGE